MKWNDILVSIDMPWIITFICSGNVMRSPFAEYFARNWMRKNYSQNESKFLFRSGACMYKNSEIFSETCNWLIKEGIMPSEYDSHVPRHFDQYFSWFADSHLLVGMTHNHVDILNEHFPNKSFLLSEVASDLKIDLGDPFFSPEQTEQIIETLKDWLNKFCNNIINLI